MLKIKDKVIKLIFGNEEPLQEELLDTIIDLISSQVLLKIKTRLPEIETIPKELEYVVVELSVQRFNRIGSEGMTQETVEGHSAAYDYDNKSLMDAIDEWIDGQIFNDVARIRFL